MVVLGGALARGKISLRHDSLKRSRCDPIVDKTLMHSSAAERGGRMAGTSTVRRNNCDAMETSRCVS